MWTPRRIVLLTFGAGLFVFLYVVYDHFLGAIDGLPELPAEFLVERVIDPINPPPQPISNPNRIKSSLVRAFGPGCVEATQYQIQFEIQRSGLLLAAGDYAPQPDGRMLLTPFSLAIFGKAAKGEQEVSTIHCDKAYLTFDKRIKYLTDMGTSHIVAVEMISEGKTPEERIEPLAPVGSGNPDSAGDVLQPGDDRRHGSIHLVNKQVPAAGEEPRPTAHTAAKPPDADGVLELITPGPVYYLENPDADPARNPARAHIWTATAVKLEDRRNPAAPTQVTALGMNVYLQKEEPATPGQPARRGNTGFSGVKKIDLCSDVLMRLWDDPQSGLLAPGGKSKGPPGPAAGPRLPVTIKTLGPFHYDLVTDTARFDIRASPPPYVQNYVEVERSIPTAAAGQSLNDRLFCDFLEVQFHRRKADEAAPAGKPPGEGTGELEIVQMHAWGRHVSLSSDSEDLSAQGNDLVYHRPSQRTTLRGEPEMVAVKDGNEIYARELVMLNPPPAPPLKPGEKPPPPAGPVEQARAQGPGRMYLLSKSAEAPKPAAPGTVAEPPGGQRVLVRWQDQMVVTKEQGLDVIYLTGGSAFEDPNPQAPQSLRSDRMRLWVKPADPAPVTTVAAKNPPPKPDKPKGATDTTGRRPHRLLAIDKVVADGNDFHIQDCDQLNVWFIDPPPKPPAPPPPAAAAAPPAAPPAPGAPAAPPPVPAPPPEKRRDPPMDLKARTVEMFVFYGAGPSDGRGELEHMTGEGDVHVHQDARAAGEKPTDLFGDKMLLTHYPGTSFHRLLMNGTPAALAEMHLPTLSLAGPEVMVDQSDNQAEVKGGGTMRMLSATDINGNKLDRPTPMTVAWTRGMSFLHGRHAVFTGGVQAEQDTTRLLCEQMQVFLDRPISLGQTDKSSGPPGLTAKPVTPPAPAPATATAAGPGKPAGPAEQAASVDKVICDSVGKPQPVYVIQRGIEKDGSQRYQRIEAPVLSLDNLEKRAEAPAMEGRPGRVFIWQMGQKDSMAGPAPPPQPGQPAKPAEQQMKLTRVVYSGNMNADQRRRIVKFFGDVEVVHMAAPSPDVPINTDRMPPGAMLMHSDTLEVYSPGEAGSTGAPGSSGSQIMIAKDHATVEMDLFYGRADEIRYTEDQSQVILVGTPANPAEIRHIKFPGAEPDMLSAERFTYNRKTNQYTGYHVKNLSGR